MVPYRHDIYALIVGAGLTVGAILRPQQSSAVTELINAMRGNSILSRHGRWLLNYTTPTSILHQSRCPALPCLALPWWASIAVLSRTIGLGLAINYTLLRLVLSLLIKLSRDVRNYSMETENCRTMSRMQ